MTEEQRLNDFIEAYPKPTPESDVEAEATSVFYWIKGIFSSWITDQTDNYRNFFTLGLKPVTNEHLLAAKASFQKGLDDCNAELESRGLL